MTVGRAHVSSNQRLLEVWLLASVCLYDRLQRLIFLQHSLVLGEPVQSLFRSKRYRDGPLRDVATQYLIEVS